MAVVAGPRGIGKTTAMVQAVKALESQGAKAVLVCLNVQDARRVADMYEITTISSTIDADSLRGVHDKVFMFDPDAVARIILDFEYKLDKSTVKTKRLEERIRRLTEVLSDVDKDCPYENHNDDQCPACAYRKIERQRILAGGG
jgi:signal recognition particle GTPase